MGQRVSREEETAEHAEEEKGGGLFGWLYSSKKSPDPGDKRSRDHVDESKQDLPAAKKSKTTEETAYGGASSKRVFVPVQGKPESNETKPGLSLKQPAIDWSSVKEDCIPKPPFGSYIAFSMDRRPDLQRENPNAGSVEIANMLGEEWRASAELRQEYKDRQDKLKAEYKAKMAELGLPIPKIHKKEKKGKLSKQKKEGKSVDDGRPKRPITTYLRFAKEYRPIIKQENPAATGMEINAALSERWKGISEELRAKYTTEYAIAQESYNQEMAKWVATQGQKNSDVGKHAATEPKSSTKESKSEPTQQSEPDQVANIGQSDLKSPVKLPTKSNAPQIPSIQPPKSSAPPTSSAKLPYKNPFKLPITIAPAPRSLVKGETPPKSPAKQPADNRVVAEKCPPKQTANSASPLKRLIKLSTKSSAYSESPAKQPATGASASKQPSKSIASSKSPAKQPAPSPAEQQSKSAGTHKSPAKQQSDTAQKNPSKQPDKRAKTALGDMPDVVHPGKALAQKEMAADSNPVAAFSQSVPTPLPQQSLLAAVPPTYYNPSVYPLPYGYNPAAYPYTYRQPYGYSYNFAPPPQPGAPCPILPKPNETTGGNNATATATASISTKPSKEKQHTI